MAQPESKVVDARNENRILFKGTEDDSRDYVERNFPRHHVDPAAPMMEHSEPDVLLVTPSGKETYLGPEHEEGWVKVPARQTTGGKT